MQSFDPLKFKIFEERDQIVHKWIISFDMSELWRTDLGLLAEELRLFKILWLKPIEEEPGVWLLDADAMRKPEQGALVSFMGPSPPPWLRGKIRVSPVFPQPPLESPSVVLIEFRIRREDALIQNQFDLSGEYSTPLRAFFTDHRSPERVGFLMMRFEDSRLHLEIIEAIRTVADDLGLTVVRADDKRYSEDLLTNIRIYMHGCAFGVAVFERLTSEDFNPNVSLEVGYMMALGKPICLLRDSTLPSLHTDLVGRLYESFDTQDPMGSIRKPMLKWFQDKELVSAQE